MLKNIFKQTLHTWLFGQTKLSDIAERACVIDADGLDLSIEAEGKNSPAELLKLDIAGIMKDNNLAISSSTPLFTLPWMDFCDSNAVNRQKTIDFTKKCIDVNVHAGCDRMLVVPGIVSVNHKYHGTREEDWNRAVDAIRIAG